MSFAKGLLNHYEGQEDEHMLFQERQVLVLAEIAESLKRLANQGDPNIFEVRSFGKEEPIAVHDDSEDIEREIAGTIYRAWEEQDLPTNFVKIAQELLKHYDIRRK